MDPEWSLVWLAKGLPTVEELLQHKPGTVYVTSYPYLSTVDNSIHTNYTIWLHVEEQRWIRAEGDSLEAALWEASHRTGVSVDTHTLRDNLEYTLRLCTFNPDRLTYDIVLRVGKLAVG